MVDVESPSEASMEIDEICLGDDNFGSLLEVDASTIGPILESRIEGLVEVALECGALKKEHVTT